jgi:hypothetical protein
MSGINLKIQKKDLFLLSAIMVFLVAVGFVVAYNPTNTPAANPAVMGHSINELEPCGESQTLQVISGKWACAGNVGCLETYNSLHCSSHSDPDCNSNVLSLNLNCPNGKQVAVEPGADLLYPVSIMGLCRYEHDGHFEASSYPINESRPIVSSEGKVTGWHCGLSRHLEYMPHTEKVSIRVQCCDSYTQYG